MRDAKQVEPPKGRPIVAVGRIISADEFSTSVAPFCAVVIWEKGNSFEGWFYFFTEYQTRLSVARQLDDEVKIDYWADMPEEGK